MLSLKLCSRDYNIAYISRLGWKSMYGWHIVYIIGGYERARLTTSTTTHSRLTPRETTHSHERRPIFRTRHMMVTYVHHNNHSARRLIDHRGSRGQDRGVRRAGLMRGAEGCGWVMIISVYNILLLLPIIILLLLSYAADYRRRDWRWERGEGGRGGTTRDRSSSSSTVQIFSQRVDDFYIYYLL